MDKIHEILHSTLNNPSVYFLFLALSFFVGGMDELFKTLLGLLFVDGFICVLSKERSNIGLLKTALKIIIMVALGTMVDRLLGLDQSTIMSARVCMLYGYSYNLVCSIYNTVILDETFYIPPKLRGVLEKLREKVEEEADEWDE